MPVKTDSFSIFDSTLAATLLTDPWLHSNGEEPKYGPDYGLLERLLTIPVTTNKTSASGSLAGGVDSWLAHELRRAGFSEDEVWPRATRPRVLPRDVATLLNKLPKILADEIRARIENMPAVAPSDAHFLGRAYDKQVDVAIARWDRGPELLLSTKTQVSSFGKNLSNRFEEAYGDAANLSSRYPLAAVGFFFVQRDTILRDEPDAFERTIDMMRKLRNLGGTNGYTATGLALIHYDDPSESSASSDVRLILDRVPQDVRPEQFMVGMLRKVLDATPVSQHVAVRGRMERRAIPIAEDDPFTAEGTNED
ncbi:PaeR7I family type II restriction endonuclease [Curtobacterium sp. MCLR17_032]|uniref:PaeR7I family type II restriction endonuclease n=1 Tax=Curtobacterium sp. MCLR17_032 TaxID=2175650 RepID=UPI001C652F3B|nr:PaeR7I family type II restriction endonuclease [Curtobacterium sp. MCLR17_032]WIE62770.1 PaeR7I family type II restriction endonuclease [Curtobacterium sp. MCLR17_032]